MPPKKPPVDSRNREATSGLAEADAIDQGEIALLAIVPTENAQKEPNVQKELTAR
jgi:hypothetical protein